MSRPVMGFLYIYLMYLYNTHVTVEIQFLGTFAKLRKGAVRFIMCVCASVRKTAERGCYVDHVCLPVHPSVRMKQPGCHWMDYHEILIFQRFFKISQENSSPVEI